MSEGYQVAYPSRHPNLVKASSGLHTNFIPEQFTVKAHPALFEGEWGSGEEGWA